MVPKSELDATWAAPYCHFSGHTFLPRFLKRGGTFYAYLRVMADEDAAAAFRVSLEVVNPDSNATVRCPGVRVYNIDMRWQDLIEDGEGVLPIEQKMAKKIFYAYKDGDRRVSVHKLVSPPPRYCVDVTYKIKKLKI